MNIVVAVDQKWAIGRGGDQLVYLSEDLKRFRTLTTGHTVILGRKTLATFPGGRPLKNRHNLILTTDRHYQVEGAQVCHSVDELLQAADEEAFVIGGASVYRQLLPWCTTAYVTKIHRAYPADCYFPNLDEMADWELTFQSKPLDQDGVEYHYTCYRRTGVPQDETN